MFIHVVRNFVFVLEGTKMATTGIFVILCDWVRHCPEELDFHRTRSKLFLSQTEMDTFTTPRVVSRPYVLKTVAVKLVSFVK